MIFETSRTSAPSLATSIWASASSNSNTGLYIDHDLGEINTGYDLVVWALQNGLCPKQVFIVSANPVGRDNIARALVSEGYTKLNPYEFILE